MLLLCILGSDILNIKKLSMPPQTTNCIITIVSNPEINVNDGRHTLDGKVTNIIYVDVMSFIILF